MSTYVRTVRTFHKRGCPVLKRAKAVHDWNWMDTNAHLTPEGYGRAVRGMPGYVQACRRCWPIDDPAPAAVPMTDEERRELPW